MRRKKEKLQVLDKTFKYKTKLKFCQEFMNFVFRFAKTGGTDEEQTEGVGAPEGN